MTGLGDGKTLTLLFEIGEYIIIKHSRQMEM